MLSYPVRLIPTERKTVKAVFPDVPEAVAEGETEEEALHRAKFALELALGHRLHDNKEIPAPTEVCGAPIISTDKFILQPAPSERKSPISGGRY